MKKLDNAKSNPTETYSNNSEEKLQEQETNVFTYPCKQHASKDPNSNTVHNPGTILFDLT